METDQQKRGKEKRRSVLNGYPVTKKFTTEKEVRDYLSKDTITCLLCGKAFKSLRPHLLGIHTISLDKYKSIYGIPKPYGLVGRNTNERMVAFCGRVRPIN